MKKYLLSLFLMLFFISTYSQKKYWQQEVNFTINVSLNDNDHSIDAFETIEYINNSPDTLRYIWLHLWPNAYKNDQTAYSEQMLKYGDTKFYFAKPEDRGYINRLDFKVNNEAVKVEGSADTIDVVKLILPRPLAPGKKTTITTPFHVKLPLNFSRGGHIGNDYQVTQWFPKPAVYDQKGWHPMPYLEQGEFYSEFGNYDVEITAPGSYLVAATGILQDEETLKEIKEKGKATLTSANKTWRYKQNNVHDFAWFASKDFAVSYDTVRLSSKRVVDVFSYYKPAKDNGWAESVSYAKDGLRKYSEWIGDYPYNVATVVQGSENENSGGMEYPTITLVTTAAKGHELDATIVHELGHNWFYGALASNERKHPWMDEGMNTFYQKRYEVEKYGTYSHLEDAPQMFRNRTPDDLEELLMRSMQKMQKDQPIETPSEEFSKINYGLVTYFKASRWMKLLESDLGRGLFDESIKKYYNEWKFKHPYPEDFKASVERSTKRSLEDIFGKLKTTGPLQHAEQKKSPKLSFLFNLKDTEKYNYIHVAPVVGFNSYDKVMPGVMIHNYQLPLNNFNFIAGALYGTGSSKLNNFGRASYTIYNKRYNLEPALSFINYTINDFNFGDGKVFPRVRRITPSLKFTAFPKDALSKQRFTAEAKSFVIKEEELDFKDVIIGPDTTPIVGTRPFNRTVNRASLTYQDDRELYPYNISLSADQGKSFLRTALTIKYYFNYKDGKSGLNARLFAGKFFYLKDKTLSERINNDRYALNMSGPSGYEDYTYSNYFLGRREFEGLPSRQLMERDGFFKVRSEQLSEEIGKTDDWLISLNLETDLPGNINPLSVLPFKVPLKVFIDVGTYADASRANSGTGRFLYDAGFQLPLLNSLINIYFPVIYSKVYADFYKSTFPKGRFARNIVFNIDIEKLRPTKLLSELRL